MEDIRKVVSFDSVEEFWGLYNNVVPPSQLPGKANYYLFKDGIMPAWEDPQNKNGGKWAIQLPRDKSKPVIDQMWLYTVGTAWARRRLRLLLRLLLCPALSCYASSPALAPTLPPAPACSGSGSICEDSCHFVPLDTSAAQCLVLLLACLWSGAGSPFRCETTT